MRPDHLRAARGLLDYSREQVAKESGLSQETIKNVESENFNPSASTTIKLLTFFRVKGIDFMETPTLAGLVWQKDMNDAVTIQSKTLRPPTRDTGKD